MLEDSYLLKLHELLLSPEAHWRTKATIPCPEPSTASKEWHSLSACWVPDDSAVLLQYNLQDWQDGRAAWAEEGYFVVRVLLGAQLASLRCMHSQGPTCTDRHAHDRSPAPACVGR